MQAEHLMGQLSIDRSNTKRMRVFRSLDECGSTATEDVKIVRGVTWWRNYFGSVEGINKCMVVICLYCNTEIVAEESEKLHQRLFDLKASGEIANTVTHSGSFTFEHHSGDNIEKLTELLEGALNAVLMDPEISHAIAGGYFALECPGGEAHGAHPHVQCFISLHGQDEWAHIRIKERIHTLFRDFIETHSLAILGERRTVAFRGVRLSSDGPGDEGFRGRNPWSTWSLFCEVTLGFAKDDGYCLTVSADDYAEVYSVMEKRNGFLRVGMWDSKGNLPALRRKDVIGIIPAVQWNRLYNNTTRILRTVVMDTYDWNDEELREYIDIANQESHPHLIDYFIRCKFGEDCAKIPGFDRMIVY